MAEHALTQYPLPEYPQCTLGMRCRQRLMGENERSTQRAPGVSKTGQGGSQGQGGNLGLQEAELGGGQNELKPILCLEKLDLYSLLCL